MKKILILIILHFFCLHRNGFAIIHRAVNPNMEMVQKMPFKLVLKAKRDTSRQECVQIHLKNGTIVYGKVSSMDATQLFFKPCDSKDTLITSISIKTLSQVTDARGKIIFNNELKTIAGKTEKKGVFLAHFSFGVIITSVVSLILFFILPKSAIVASQGFLFPIFTNLGYFLLLLFFWGSLLSFIIGIISLKKLKNSNNKFAKRKAWISVVPGLLYLLLVLLLIVGG